MEDFTIWIVAALRSLSHVFSRGSEMVVLRVKSSGRVEILFLRRILIQEQRSLIEKSCLSKCRKRVVLKNTHYYSHTFCFHDLVSMTSILADGTT